jgi:hypothetical protein
VFRRHVEPADWRGFPVGGFIDERHARQVIKNSINITTEHSVETAESSGPVWLETEWESGD